MKLRFIHAALTAGLLGALPAAHAVPTLRLTTETGATITCADGAACDVNSLAGAVTFVGSVGDFSLNVTSGLSKPFLTNGQPLMDLNSLNATTTGGQHRLTIELSDTSFQLGGRFGEFGGVLSSGAGASVEASAFYDTGDALWAQSTLMGRIGAFGPGAFSGTFFNAFAPSGPYSLTQIITISTVGASTFSGDFEVNLPEPTTLALLGLGLVGFAATRRRRQAS